MRGTRNVCPSFLHSRKHVGHFRVAHSIELLKAPAQLIGELFRLLVAFVFDDHLEVDVGSRHCPNDTITAVKCTLCETRKPRRFCPGVNNQICAPCCGEARENTVNCPIDCEYLLEARSHERYIDVDPASIPNRDIELTEEYLERIDPLIGLFSRFLLVASIETEGAVDQDMREAIEALVKSYRTRQSGLIYDSRPENAIAASIQQRVTTALTEFTDKVQEKTGSNPIRDADILGALIFWQRFSLHINNGRPKGRSFITILFDRVNQLNREIQARPEPESGPSLLVP